MDRIGNAESRVDAFARVAFTSKRRIRSWINDSQTMDDTELIGSEIGYFIRPAKKHQLRDAILRALAIAAFVAFMIWFATL